jgi:hypothetical protein
MASEDSDQFARLGLHLLLEEATFFVMTEPIHPTTKLDQPFLLVFRTRHVVTMMNAWLDVHEVVRDTTGFSSI